MEEETIEKIEEKEEKIEEETPIENTNQLVESDKVNSEMSIQIAPSISADSKIEQVEDYIEKGFYAKAVSDESFVKKGATDIKKRILKKHEHQNKIEEIKATTEQLDSLSNEAVEYFNYHQKILNAVGIDSPLSISSMKFWMVIGTFYYFILRFFYFIKDICSETLQIVSFILETISNSIAKVVSSLFNMLTSIITSSSKAIKAFGWLLVGVLFILLIIGIVYFIPKLIGIDIFALIKAKIGG